MLNRGRILAAFLALAVLALAPGVLVAGCADCHSCCRPMSVASVGAPSCCGSVKAAPPEEALPGTVPPAPAPLVAAGVVELPGETAAGWAAPEPLPDPPPLLHEGIRLHTLHATFLI